MKARVLQFPFLDFQPCALEIVGAYRSKPFVVGFSARFAFARR
jgi:hypothetical protein